MCIVIGPSIYELNTQYMGRVTHLFLQLLVPTMCEQYRRDGVVIVLMMLPMMCPSGWTVPTDGDVVEGKCSVFSAAAG